MSDERRTVTARRSPFVARRSRTTHHERRTVRDLIRAGTQQLEAAGQVNARHEAEWLLGQLIGVRRLELYLEERTVEAPVIAAFFTQIHARAFGTPLQYLLGEAEFFGERFLVAPGVFIPRPETEAVVDAALQVLRPMAQRQTRALRLLDLGSGSGCIAVTLARALPACVVVAVELSWNALTLAQRNVHRAGLSGRVHLVRSSWCEALAGAFDGVLSNPPYVPSATVDQVPLDVRQEPRLSLDGGAQGLVALYQVLDSVPRILKPGGVAAFECAEEQVEVLIEQARARRWGARVTPIVDLARRPRGIMIHA